MTRTIGPFGGPHRFLSNFWPATVIGEDDVAYPTVEHAYQASKTYRLAWKQVIGELPANQAGLVKQLGRYCTLRPNWENDKLRVMLDLLRQKFNIPELREQLIATGDAKLVERNWWHDNFWGDCTCGRDECAAPGLNHLGNMLMAVRLEVDPNLF